LRENIKIEYVWGEMDLKCHEDVDEEEQKEKKEDEVFDGSTFDNNNSD